MKKKVLFLALLSTLAYARSFGQLMTFGFIKNCMTYERSTATDELKKKQFFVADRNVAVAESKLLEGATYYSNSHEPDKGEIKVLSQINGSTKITEVAFKSGTKNDYNKNFKDIHNQMISFFNNEITLKSPKYKTDVLKYTKDKLFYYVYENNKVPVIVISNNKIDEAYFEVEK